MAYAEIKVQIIVDAAKILRESYSTDGSISRVTDSIRILDEYIENVTFLQAKQEPFRFKKNTDERIAKKITSSQNDRHSLLREKSVSSETSLKRMSPIKPKRSSQSFEDVLTKIGEREKMLSKRYIPKIRREVLPSKETKKSMKTTSSFKNKLEITSAMINANKTVKKRSTEKCVAGFKNHHSTKILVQQTSIQNPKKEVPTESKVNHRLGGKNKEPATMEVDHIVSANNFHLEKQKSNEHLESERVDNHISQCFIPSSESVACDDTSQILCPRGKRIKLDETQDKIQNVKEKTALNNVGTYSSGSEETSDNDGSSSGFFSEEEMAIDGDWERTEHSKRSTMQQRNLHHNISQKGSVNEEDNRSEVQNNVKQNENECIAIDENKSCIMSIDEPQTDIADMITQIINRIDSRTSSHKGTHTSSNVDEKHGGNKRIATNDQSSPNHGNTLQKACDEKTRATHTCDSDSCTRMSMNDTTGERGQNNTEIQTETNTGKHNYKELKRTNFKETVYDASFGTELEPGEINDYSPQKKCNASSSGYFTGRPFSNQYLPFVCQSEKKQFKNWYLLKSYGKMRHSATTYSNSIYLKHTTNTRFESPQARRHWRCESQKYPRNKSPFKTHDTEIGHLASRNRRGFISKDQWERNNKIFIEQKRTKSSPRSKSATTENGKSEVITRKERKSKRSRSNTPSKIKRGLANLSETYKNTLSTEDKKHKLKEKKTRGNLVESVRKILPLEIQTGQAKRKLKFADDIHTKSEYEEGKTRDSFSENHASTHVKPSHTHQQKKYSTTHTDTELRKQKTGNVLDEVNCSGNGRSPRKNDNVRTSLGTMRSGSFENNGVMQFKTDDYIECFELLRDYAFKQAVRYSSDNFEKYAKRKFLFEDELILQLKRNFERYLVPCNISDVKRPMPRFVSAAQMTKALVQTWKEPHVVFPQNRQLREFDDVIGYVGFSIPCYWCELVFDEGKFLRSFPVLDPIGHRNDTMYCQTDQQTPEKDV